MPDENTVATTQIHTPPDEAKSPVVSTGGVSIATNLPHGMTIAHKGFRVKLNGANSKGAIYMGGTASGKWGFTHNIDEAWFDDWTNEQQPVAFTKGLIRKNTAKLISGQVAEQSDAIKTGADPIDPDKKTGDGVEKKTDKD